MVGSFAGQVTLLTPKEQQQGSEAGSWAELFAVSLAHPGQSPDTGCHSVQALSIQ